MKRRTVVFAVMLLGWNAPAESQVPAPFDPSGLLPRIDSYELRLNGNTIGTQTVILERSPAGFIFRETTIMPGGTQTTEVRFDADLQMTSVRQEGQMGGAEMHIDVVYADGRASGTARVPGPEGMRAREVDARIPPNAIDDNVLALLLPTLAWAPGAVWTLPVFASGKGELMEYTIRAGSVETTTTAAGTYRTYNAEATGGDRTVVFHVTADAPHQLIRITLPGTPIEIVWTHSAPQAESR
jgi:hypothetical protein